MTAVEGGKPASQFYLTSQVIPLFGLGKNFCQQWPNGETVEKLFLFLLWNQTSISRGAGIGLDSRLGGFGWAAFIHFIGRFIGRFIRFARKQM